MEVVDVSDFPCHSDGEEVVLLDLDKPSDPEANDEQPTGGVQDEPDQVDQVDEVTVVVDDVPGEESRDDSVTTTTATVIDVVETCDGVSQSEQTEMSNIVELISNTSINEISCDDSVAETDRDISQSSEVIGLVAHPSTILEDVKNDCLSASDDDVDNMLFVEEESIEDANNTSNENEEINNIDVNACDIVIDEGTNELADINDKINKSMNKGSVTIETKNPDGSIVVKKDNLTVTIPQHIAGRDIAALNEDTPSRSGKRMLNPRFGVKVPYIHMTSQIVTQDEIAQELFQRFQQKYPLTRVDKPDKLFSMKLTHKLANKIAPVKTPDKKFKDVSKNSKKVINAKKELNKKLGKIESQSLNTTKSLESVLNSKIPNFELSNDSKESTDTNDSQHIVQITNTLHSFDESAADLNNLSDDKNCEKITSNEELIAILEDFETIEVPDTNGNEIADANTIGVADANIIQVVDTSGIIVEDTNGNNIVNQTANSIIVTDMNGEKPPETPPVVRKKMVRSTTRTKRCKPKLDPEIEKQIALKQLQEVSRPKRYDSHYSKRKAETEKKLVKNDIGSAQKRKKTTPDDVPEVKIAIDHYIKSYTDKRQSIVKVEPNSNDETVSDNVNEIEPEIKPNNVAKSRTMREINRLLGDEGAINMIYSLEKRRSPGNSNSMNILPSPRRMKKDLMLKTKLVKNAMLKMSVPTSSPMSANRLGRRSDVCTPSPSPEKKCTRKTSIDSQGSDHSITKTVLANESKIIRKHSSSSEASSVGGCTIHPVPTAIPISDETIKHTPVKALRVYTRKNKNSNLSSMMDQSLNDVSKGTNKNVKTKNAVSQKVKKQPVSKMSRSLAESIKQDIENSPYNEITVRRYDEVVVHITLTPVTPVMKNALNISVMEELMKELNNLKDDDTCKVVLVSSAGRIFCQGLDVSPLIHNDPEHCKKAAVEISSTLKKFITCLSDFPKLLVAGVDGAAVGLGATMLVHFDLVFASDKATFETPYAQLGHIAEGAATTILGRLLVAELIMGSQRLTAGQAHYYGLVTRTLWPDRFHDELIPLVKSLARHSLQTLKTSKALLKQEIKEKLAKALESETQILVQQWTGDECQQNFQTYLSDAVDNINV